MNGVAYTKHNIGPANHLWLGGRGSSTQVIVKDQDGFIIAQFSGCMAKVNAGKFLGVMNAKTEDDRPVY